MDASDAKAYRGRWEAVAKLKQKEQQPPTLAENWSRLNGIKRRATRLGIKRGNDDGEMEIFLLWAKLKVSYGSS